MAKPSFMLRYVTHNLLYLALAHRLPIDIALPWFAYAAIDFLEHYIDARMTVFEYGTGGSTLFFSARCKAVVSVEDNEEWLATLGRQVEARGLKNLTLYHRPFDFKNPINFDESAYVGAIGDGIYDIIVIDGQDESLNERPVCFLKAEEHVRQGGIIIVDDSWRPTYSALRCRSRARRVEVFESPGPLRYGVTSTDIYFY
jgi:predicted O-methyltransferase YrrM